MPAVARVPPSIRSASVNPAPVKKVPLVPINDALKELSLEFPSFLDVSADTVTLRLPEKLGGNTLVFEGSVVGEALQEGEFRFVSSRSGLVNWPKAAFGMSFLALRNTELSLSITEDETYVGLEGELGGVFNAGGMNIAFALAFALDDEGEIDDFLISLPNSKMELASIPGVKKLPGAKMLSISSPQISLNAVSGTVTFAGKEVLGVLFATKMPGEDDNLSWNFAVKLGDSLSLADVTGVRGTFLDALVLPRMRAVMSSGLLQIPYEELPLAAVAVFEDDQGVLPDGVLDVDVGVSVQALFDGGAAPAKLKEPLATLGLSDTQFELSGSLEDFFDGDDDVSFALKASIDFPEDNAFAKSFKAKDADVGFFISVTRDGKDVSAELGFGATILVAQGDDKPDLEFEVAFELEYDENILAAQVRGEMNGSWIEPGGIKGLIISDPFLEAGFTSIGAIEFGVSGRAQIGDVKVLVACNVLLVGGTVPSALAFAGAFDGYLSFTDLGVQAAKLIAGGETTPFEKLPDIGIRDFLLAFATPGAVLPDGLDEELNLVGTGMALKGTLVVEGRDMAGINGYATTEGILFDGYITPFDLGPLELREASCYIQAGANVPTEISFSGDFKVLVQRTAYKLVIAEDCFEYRTRIEFTKFLKVNVAAKTVDGLRVTKGNDLFFEAGVEADFKTFVQTTTAELLNATAKADAWMKGAQNTLRREEENFQRKQRDLDNLLKKMRNGYKPGSDAAVREVEKAQSVVNQREGAIRRGRERLRKAERHAKRGKIWEKAARRAKAESIRVELGYLYSERAVALTALEAAKAVLRGLPIDQTAVLTRRAALEVAEQSLMIARQTVRGADFLEDQVSIAIREIADLALDSADLFELKKATVKGSLKGAAGKGGQTPTIEIHAVVLGKPVHWEEEIDVDVITDALKARLREFAKKIFEDLKGKAKKL